VSPQCSQALALYHNVLTAGLLPSRPPDTLLVVITGMLAYCQFSRQHLCRLHLHHSHKQYEQDNQSSNSKAIK
jgi:hypothetical protein